VNDGSSREPVIRTPDQRLRVFVSSTLGELADERRVVSRAISTMRLTPVMFELGARPHSPQDLYRAYLAQSDIFIGLYWQSYGWITPGMQISGLEEEFELSRSLPRLLYVKMPAPDRESRLTDLVNRIKQEASYRKFNTLGELSRLVRDDLATLLSERFATQRPVTEATESGSPPTSVSRDPRSLPLDTTSLIGRAQVIDEVAGLIDRPDVRLLTLFGPGGIGKTRLAAAVGERVRKRFGSGIVFVPLAAVSQPTLVLASIARAVGTNLVGMGSALEGLVERFVDGRWLLILDNLEQVVDAAGDLDQLLARCSGLSILVTSTIVLRLRAERAYRVPPLPLPDPTTLSVQELQSQPAVALFLDRARAVRHDFVLTNDNASAVVEICRRLEGLPLAIELAAARVRLLDPDTLLRRLERSLDALGTGTVDMPERQRTLRATVQWSVEMLDDAERSLLEIVAVFVDGWTIDAAADVASLGEDLTLELSETLASHSLLHADDTELGTRSRMLETIRAFVAERLAARPDIAEIQRRHADYYRVLAEQADRPLRSIGNTEWLERLETEAENLSAAIRWYLANDPALLPHLFRVLWQFWELRDHLSEARVWVEQLLTATSSLDSQTTAELQWTAAVTALEVGDDIAALAARDRLQPLLPVIKDPFMQALSQLAMAWTYPISGDFDAALRGALASLDHFRGQDEQYWRAVAFLTASYLESAIGRYNEALSHLHEARDLSEQFDYTWLVSWTRVQLGTMSVDRPDEARALLSEGLDLSLASHSTRNLSLCLDGFARLALVEGDPQRTALLSGAAEGLRQRVGLKLWPMMRQSEADLVARGREALGAKRFNEVFAAGARLNQQEALAVVNDHGGDREHPTNS